MTKQEIVNFMDEQCKSGSDCTHGLKVLGDGDMREGLNNLATFYENEGIKKGGIIGAVASLVTVGVFYGAFTIRNWYKKSKEESKALEERINKAQIESEEK